MKASLKACGVFQVKPPPTPISNKLKTSLLYQIDSMFPPILLSHSHPHPRPHHWVLELLSCLYILPPPVSLIVRGGWRRVILYIVLSETPTGCLQSCCLRAFCEGPFSEKCDLTPGGMWFGYNVEEKALVLATHAWKRWSGLPEGEHNQNSWN